MDDIKLSNFEGPLDLLLHLVKEGSENIFDIDIAFITDKYLEYINNEDNLDINVSSEYLVSISLLRAVHVRESSSYNDRNMALLVQPPYFFKGV